MSLEVEPVTALIGATISGVDLREPLLKLHRVLSTEGREVLHEGRRLIAGQIEARHTDLQPRSEGFDLLQESMEPRVLQLGTFAAQ